MVSKLVTTSPSQIPYPDSDSLPIVDNTQQFRWIVTLKENLEILFENDANVFIAGDLLWYPVEGSHTIRQAPDAMVIFGRPKGDRSAYQQWEESGIAPQVVFEILTPHSRMSEMIRKFSFYERYGVEEYYLYDPDRVDFVGWMRQDDRLDAIADAEDWISPRLGIRFQLQPSTLVITRPDGQPFLSFLEIDQRRRQAEHNAEQAQQQVQRLAAKLRELGIDPNDL